LGQVSDTALTSERAIEMSQCGLPNTFVPARNLIFLSFASAVAYRRGLNVLVGGMCETDFSGYPDCRDNTMKAMQVALSLGLDAPMAIETPLMWLDKAQTWALGDTLGGAPFTELVVEHTHSCYLGERTTRHAWGHGCGHCPAVPRRPSCHPPPAEGAGAHQADAVPRSASARSAASRAGPRRAIVRLTCAAASRSVDCSGRDHVRGCTVSSRQTTPKGAPLIWKAVSSIEHTPWTSK
jgi:queuosine biosynthesis protein QueC